MTEIITCDFCNEPRAYTHKNGLEVCQFHYEKMTVKYTIPDDQDTGDFYD